MQITICMFQAKYFFYIRLTKKSTMKWSVVFGKFLQVSKTASFLNEKDIKRVFST